MSNKQPFDKGKKTKIPFEDLVELINQKCDYKFSIIDNEVDEELIALAKKEGIDLTGYKHVIETSGRGIPSRVMEKEATTEIL